MKYISLHQLFLLLIVLVTQQNTISGMDCPGCDKRFNKSVNLINHYNRNHTNKEFYLYTQDKDYIPKKTLKRTIKTHPKQMIQIKKEKKSPVLKLQSEKTLQERLTQRFLIEIPQQVDFKMEFPQQDSFQANNDIFFSEFPTSIHNTDYLEWTEK